MSSYSLGMKYIIIEDETLQPVEHGLMNWNILDKESGLIAKVSNLISRGWKPQGGVSYGAGKFLQAMTRCEEE